MKFAFFGSSLVSSYWNGACTYYRGLIRSLHERGHEIVFYEPIAYERQEHRDSADPDYARVVVYDAQTEQQALRAVESARHTCAHRVDELLAICRTLGVADEVPA